MRASVGARSQSIRKQWFWEVLDGSWPKIATATPLARQNGALEALCQHFGAALAPLGRVLGAKMAPWRRFGAAVAPALRRFLPLLRRWSPFFGELWLPRAPRK